MHRLTPEEARRVAVRAQLLDARRPTDLVRAVERLAVLQIDPTSAVAPSADLVAWSRLGASYSPADLTRAVEVDRSLTELVAMIRPTSELPVHLGLSGLGAHPNTQRWLKVNDRFRRNLLARLRADGPLLSRDLDDTSVELWDSAGWNANRNITRMLELMVMRGEVAVAARQGRQRVFDVASRVYPPGTKPLPDAEARVRRDELRLRALGIARATGTVLPGEPGTVGWAGEPAVVEGVDGEWRVDPAQLGLPFTGRTALLSPFDRLVHDRARLRDLFGFEYALEMYKPAAKRRWGYYALPVLHGDRLVGKLDAKADRKAGVLRVSALHEDVWFTKAMRADVHAEVDALAGWLGLRRI
ncbi:MAG: YcaQ family DNA glycosylase [Acidothermales bacterium]|nr:YcaQ family DNA glycosylase [Acidothermales bacterium]